MVNIRQDGEDRVVGLRQDGEDCVVSIRQDGEDRVVSIRGDKTVTSTEVTLTNSSPPR